MDRFVNASIQEMIGKRNKYWRNSMINFNIFKQELIKRAKKII